MEFCNFILQIQRILKNLDVPTSFSCILGLLCSTTGNGLKRGMDILGLVEKVGFVTDANSKRLGDPFKNHYKITC